MLPTQNACSQSPQRILKSLFQTLTEFAEIWLLDCRDDGNGLRQWSETSEFQWNIPRCCDWIVGLLRLGSVQGQKRPSFDIICRDFFI